MKVTRSSHKKLINNRLSTYVVNYWRKYVHEVLVNRLGGLRLTKEVGLTDLPDTTIDV